MALRSKIKAAGFLTIFAGMLSVVACDKLSDSVDAARTRIISHLNSQGIYERDNVPETVSSTAVKGYYDIIGGAFRYITTEGQNNGQEINAGDSVSFYFDARIFSTTFDNSTTFYTNIASRIEYIGNNNPQFDPDPEEWPTTPLRIKVGGGDILKAISSALPSCRAGDVVRIFLPPDVAFGSNQVMVVPAKSTLVFELSELEIISGN